MSNDVLAQQRPMGLHRGQAKVALAYLSMEGRESESLIPTRQIPSKIAKSHVSI